MDQVVYYGLAANPPTVAHVEIIKRLVEKYPDSEIVIDLPYVHPWGKNMVCLDDRRDMLSVAIGYETLSQHDIRLIELDTSATTTNERICWGQLTGKLPIISKDITIVIGSDHIPVFNKWEHHERLLKYHNFCIIDRGPLDDNGKNMFTRMFLSDEFGFNGTVDWIKLDDSMLHVSSTKIRNAVDTIKAMLPREIWHSTDLLKLFGVE